MTHGGGDEIAEWQHLVADLPVMFVVTRSDDGEAVIEDCNPRFAETLGYDESEVIGSQLAEFYTPASRRAFRAGDYARAMEDDFTTAERELVREDGTVVHTLLRAVPRRDDDGTVIGTWALFVDVTDREQRRRQASILNRLLRHNLRNDMTVVLGHASLLVERLTGQERESALTIIETAERWGALIEKSQRIREVLEADERWRRTDLATVLGRLERELGSDADAEVHVLTPSGKHITIRPEIELALTELCENALAHADPDDPEVVVTAAVTDDDTWVQLTVADNGPAIPDRELVPLVDDEATPLVHGTGLGLWIVRIAVDRVGGDVSVVQNDENGTVVRLRYPA